MLAPLLWVRLHLKETETEIITSLNCWAIVVWMKLNWFNYWLLNCVVDACSLMHFNIFIIRLVVSSYSTTFFVQLLLLLCCCRRIGIVEKCCAKIIPAFFCFIPPPKMLFGREKMNFAAPLWWCHCHIYISPTRRDMMVYIFFSVIYFVKTKNENEWTKEKE